MAGLPVCVPARSWPGNGGWVKELTVGPGRYGWVNAPEANGNGSHDEGKTAVTKVKSGEAGA